MFKVIENKVVKVENVESLIDVSSALISDEIKSIDNVIENLSDHKKLLLGDLETVLELEKTLEGELNI